MKQTVDYHDFVRAFEYAGRENNFSREGLGILFDWIEQLDADTGQDTELDVIALCCDFCEMSLQELIDAYDLEADTHEREAEGFISEQTILCGSYEAEGTTYFIFQQF